MLSQVNTIVLLTISVSPEATIEPTKSTVAETSIAETTESKTSLGISLSLWVGNSPLSLLGRFISRSLSITVAVASVVLVMSSVISSMVTSVPADNINDIILLTRCDSDPPMAVVTVFISTTIETSKAAIETPKASIAQAPVAEATVSSLGLRGGFSRSHKPISRLQDSFESKTMAVVMLVLHVMMVFISEALYRYDAKECQDDLKKRDQTETL